MVLSLQHGLQPSNLAVQSGFLLTAYVSISVIMSTVGCVAGTFIGLLLSQLLAAL